LLYGRDAERSIIAGLLQEARGSRGGVLVVRGAAGVGKSALLDDARDRASDMQVLRCAGIESEAALPFAALHQLLRPVLDYVDRLPKLQATALRGALGVADGGGEDRFGVYLAVLSLLAEVAERDPLLCLVDDAHWLDDASADALVFVARRVGADPVALLFASREDEGRRFTTALPELRLGGLDPVAAGALLDRHASVPLSQEARQRLVEATGGHPLGLIELPDCLSAAQLAGTEPLQTPLPVGTHVERTFLARVRRLPPDTQTLLLVAAADDSRDATTILRAAALLGVEIAALDAAERAGLVRLRGSTLALYHPLVRSAVYQAAPRTQRQAVHRALADAFDGEVDADRRAWHRAAASLQPDPSVADELGLAAERARRRTGYAAASLAYERAATLTLDERLRGRRLIAAAECAWVAGRTERARMLLERARPLAVEPIERADLDQHRGLLEMTEGDPGDACQLLVRAAADVAPLDADRALHLLAVASVAAVYAVDRTAAVRIAELAGGLPATGAVSARMLAQLLVGLGAHARGDHPEAAARLRATLALEGQLDDEGVGETPVSLMHVGRAAIFLGDDAAAYRIQRRAAYRARAAGALGVLTQILPRLALAELWAGHPAAATADATEGLRLARELGQQDLAGYQLVVLALLAAYRGDERECRSLAAQGRELAEARRFVLVIEFAQWALTLLELGRGQAAEALLRARDIGATDAGYWAGLDRIEAAVGAGDRETAQGWLDSFAAWTENGSAWAGAVLLHARALLAEDEPEADHLFRAALAGHDQAARPFERARTELAFGAFLRRSGRRVEARTHLAAALDGFDTLGARLWGERARVELRASGQTARRRDSSTSDRLTPQELQVAHYVAQGLSNREAGNLLFLSPRTIAFHLRNVFTKLGISSRTELARLDLGAPDDGSAPATTPVTRPARA
jgi:DNA-binding CsgD family transcriptional regulator